MDRFAFSEPIRGRGAPARPAPFLHTKPIEDAKR